jgi:YrbI family 3-deoxy-D-manno-octulosonate 8-phosphate phosphatase
MVKSFQEKSKLIKLVATDIDGVWTDAKMYYTEDGDFMKAFSTYDGYAVALLKNAGIEVAILTGENSQIVQRRAEKLNISYVYLDENQKLKRLKYLCEVLNISLDNIAFIGDDLNDIDALGKVGLSALSANSPVLTNFSPDYVTRRKGGDGAFREFVDLILQNQ